MKYGVERSLDKDAFLERSDLLRRPLLNLDLPGYKGPYKDPDPNKPGLKAISTRRIDSTIVFHLKTPFSGFDYFAMLHGPDRAGVPQAKDTGTNYKEHPVSKWPVHVLRLPGRQEHDAGAQPELGPQPPTPTARRCPTSYDVSQLERQR